ncbi:MAG: transglutaminase domain-containing protein [Bacillota bacterium]
MPGKNRRLALFFLLLWSFLVLYPRPTALGESLYRLIVPPVETGAVVPLISGLPSGADPAALEKYILETFPYQHDWQVYGYPWYFPTTAEAVQKGKGDCKTRFIVLASLFEALQVPYELFISPTHIWIYYVGKEETSLENLEVALFYRDDDKLTFKLPRMNWRESAAVTWEAFWVYMPPQRKRLLYTGLVFALLLYLTPVKTRRLRS